MKIVLKAVWKALPIGLLGFAILTFIAAFMALPFMLLWNWALVPAVTVANPIGFVQAFFLAIFFSMFVVGTNGSRLNHKTD